MSHTLNLPSMATSIYKQFQKLNFDISENVVLESVQGPFSDVSHDYESVKKANGLFHKKISALGVDIKRTSLLDVVARSLGYENHHAFKHLGKIMSGCWYDFKKGRITAIVGRTGSGKSVLLLKNAGFLDSKETLVIDYGDSYSKKVIARFNKEHVTDFKGFGHATHINVQDGASIPDISSFERIIFDEASNIGRTNGASLRNAVVHAKNTHIILLVQTELDLRDLGINVKSADRVFENLGGRTDIKDGASMVRAYEFDREVIAPSLNAYAANSIFRDIQKIALYSNEMHVYVNSLSRDDYALLATAYDLGRQGWERDYYETSAYESFVENMAADGYRVTQEMADEKFFPKAKKQEQFDWLYRHMFNNAIKYNGVYSHNWLSGKTNLISETYKGVGMLHELVWGAPPHQ